MKLFFSAKIRPSFRLKLNKLKMVKTPFSVHLKQVTEMKIKRLKRDSK